MRYADYELYENSVSQIPGLHIDFADMFDTPIEELAQKIADFVEEPVPDIDFREETYDMYGGIAPYQKAFTRHDDNIEFLKKGTLSYFDKLAETKKIKQFPFHFLSWIRYLIDMMSYNLKRKKEAA